MSSPERWGLLAALLVGCGPAHVSSSGNDAGSVSHGGSSGMSTSIGGQSSARSGGSPGFDAGTFARGGTDAAGGANTLGGAGGAVTVPCSGNRSVVLALGDSITQGGDPGGYRPLLFHRALADGKHIDFVGGMANGPTTVDGVAFSNLHEGHPGYKIDVSGAGDWYGITPIVDGVLATYEPEVVLLMIGTNDILQQDDLSHAPDRLAALLDKILDDAPGTCLIVAQVTPLLEQMPFWPLDAERPGRVVMYDSAVVDVVRTRAAAGKPIALVDMYSAFTADQNFATDYLSDGIHPTPAGYEVMAETWYGALVGILR